MWKKTDDDDSTQTSSSAGPRPAPAGATAGRNRAVIGPSLTVKGDISGNEDLLIEGAIEGKVDLPKNEIMVGRSGRVKADIYGRILTIEGQVEGNLHGGEHIVLRKSSSVRGNLSAARVSLEDGSNFKGSIDMAPKEPKTDASASQQPKPPARPNQPPTASGTPGSAAAQQRRV